MRIACALLLVIALSPGMLPAAQSPSFMKEDARSPRPGLASSVFRIDGEPSSRPWTPRGERFPLGATRMAIPDGFLGMPQTASAGSAAGPSWGRRNIAIAVLASAILPGMGELYCYRASRDPWTLARVPAFVAIDGALWYSYFDNHSTGKDFKKQYEEYADAHWSLERFLSNHPCCIGIDSCSMSWEEYNSECNDQFPYFFYTPREKDREEYYENIGKYNAFVFGWDDAKRIDATGFTYWTDKRTAYVDLRNKSDEYLLKADRRLMWLIVNRVVSMLDAGWCAYRISKAEDPNEGWSLRFKTYDDAPTVIINRRF